MPRSGFIATAIHEEGERHSEGWPLDLTVL